MLAMQEVKQPLYYNYRKLNPSEQERVFLPLKAYLLYSRKFIGKYAANFAPKMLRCDEAVSYVAHHVMMGDWRWMPDLHCNRSSYRVANARFAIKSYSKLTRTLLNLGLDSIDRELGERTPLSSTIGAKNNVETALSVDDSLRQFYYMIETGGLSVECQQYMKERFVNNMSFGAIGRQFNVTAQAVEQCISYGIEKLRKKYERSQRLYGQSSQR